MLRPLPLMLRRLGICLLFLMGAAHTEAGSLTLAWDPSPSPDVEGYVLIYGVESGQYIGRIDVSNRTEFTVNWLPGGTYYFAVQAYTVDGVESTHSNEVVATVVGPALSPTTTVPSPAPTSCSTPDPFAVMGGGICCNGGWLPPGMACNTATTTTTPTTTTTTAPTASAGCSTPDPFAAMGGGICCNGGWLPPGMTCNVPTTTTTTYIPITPPITTTTTTVPAPVPTSSTGCSTPNPFASMGGGTCCNGGWLPPGMTCNVPTTTTTTYTPPPTTTTTYTPPPTTTTTTSPAPMSSAGCSTPDPFASMGGGICCNGGWLPPGMACSTPTTYTPPPSTTTTTTTTTSPTSTTGCTTPDPFASMGGGTCYNGGWLPPGMPPPDPTATPADGTGEPEGVEVTITGTLHLVSAEDGVWFIEGDDGQAYSSETEVPEELLVDGARVAFVGLLLPTISTDGSKVVEILVIEILTGS